MEGYVKQETYNYLLNKFTRLTLEYNLALEALEAIISCTKTWPEIEKIYNDLITKMNELKKSTAASRIEPVHPPPQSQ